MRHSAKVLMGLTLLALTLGLTACGARQNNTSSGTSLTLRTYTVPNGSAKKLSLTLNHVLSLSNDKNQTGTTYSAGSGQILVLAPEHMQASIAASIKQIVGQSPAAAKPSKPVRLNAWVVDAYPGTGSSDPSLKTIQPALEAFSKATEPAHFAQAHYLMAVSDIGARTALAPFPPLNFSYTVNKNDGGLVLKFNYSNAAVGLRGQVAVKLGQTLVLGLISDRPVKPSGASHSAAKPASSAGAADEGGVQGVGAVHRLLVVRITPADQS
ncbi:MAG: hypothetical protein ACRES9_12205 [Gammaproteobacteria bacterium]